jgi:hypothetical protein
MYGMLKLTGTALGKWSFRMARPTVVFEVLAINVLGFRMVHVLIVVSLVRSMTSPV